MLSPTKKDNIINNLFKSIVIQDISISSRMSDTPLQATRTEPDLTSKPCFSAKKVTLQTDRGPDTKLENLLKAHEDHFIRMEGFRLLTGDIPVLHDPRAFLTGEEWRDSICRQLSMYKFQIDIAYKSIEKAPLGSGSENIVIYDYINPETGVEWPIALDTLNRDNEDVDFSIRFRAVDVDLEESDYNYKYHQVPINLTDGLALHHGALT